MTITPTRWTSVFELARTVPNSAAFQRLYELNLGMPRCRATPDLAAKYDVAVDNSQAVLRVQNRVTLQQCWFNEARTRKPQTFAAAAADARALDSTHDGAACDFCSWQTLTAEDKWGRVEGPHAVSASNLFKYVQPAQGVILLKHHDPLAFTLEELSDLIDVSNAWFQRAAAEEAARDAALGLTPRQLHPLLLWNCLPRAGASQYHGHTQVLLSEAPFPFLQQEAEAVEGYDVTHAHLSKGFYQDLLAAHEDVGLLLREGREGDYAFAFPALAPWKDCEVNVHGSSLASPAFQRLLYVALRALIDELGVQTFNAAIHNIQLLPAGGTERGAAASAASVMGGPGGSSSSSSSAGSVAGNGSTGGAAAAMGAFDARGRPLPVRARIVSRGKLSNGASDFGGLEVFGGASIGHTDPFRVYEALTKVHGELPPLQ